MTATTWRCTMTILRRLDDLGAPAALPILVVALLLAAIGWAVADEDVPPATAVAAQPLEPFRALVCEDLDDTLLTPEEASEACVAVAGRLTRRAVGQGELLDEEVLTLPLDAGALQSRRPVPVLAGAPVDAEPGQLVTLALSPRRPGGEPILFDDVALLDLRETDEGPLATLALSSGQREELAASLATSEVRIWPAARLAEPG